MKEYSVLTTSIKGQGRIKLKHKDVNLEFRFPMEEAKEYEKKTDMIINTHKLPYRTHYIKKIKD